MGYRIQDGKRWADRKVSYQFHDSLPQGTRELFVQCMRTWESFVNEGQQHDVRFAERVNEARYVIIRRDDTGSTGNVLGSPTTDGPVTFFMNLTNKDGRDDRASIPHELGHLLGLAHEHQQSRATIVNGKRQAGTGDETPTNDATRARLYYTGGLQSVEDAYTAWSTAYLTVNDYDLQSIMHYPDARGWTWNYVPYRTRQTAIAALNYPTVEQVLAGNWRPSAGDIATVRNIYGLTPA